MWLEAICGTCDKVQQIIPQFVVNDSMAWPLAHADT
jgi:hypothetical protein